MKKTKDIKYRATVSLNEWVGHIIFLSLMPKQNAAYWCRRTNFTINFSECTLYIYLRRYKISCHCPFKWVLGGQLILLPLIPKQKAANWCRNFFKTISQAIIQSLHSTCIYVDRIRYLISLSIKDRSEITCFLSANLPSWKLLALLGSAVTGFGLETPFLVSLVKQEKN
jgi:hypothetical protein